MILQTKEKWVWCTYWTLYIAHSNSTTEQKATSEGHGPSTLKDSASTFNMAD